ncbi:MAG: ribonuclease P protein subunit [Methanosarcinales archaeon]|jgi:ribonuclease P protein subunit POP4|nr:ribonuclease P protein subunit [Methanosarcinales archaeon]
MTQIEITPAELPYHELIGLLVKVDSSCDPTINGLSGLVIDETRNTLKIETGLKSGLDDAASCVVTDLHTLSRMEAVNTASRVVTVPKKGTVFVFTLPERISQTGRQISVQIDGNITLSQPQNRIKNLKKSRK